MLSHVAKNVKFFLRSHESTLLWIVMIISSMGLVSKVKMIGCCYTSQTKGNNRKRCNGFILARVTSIPLQYLLMSV